MTLQIRFSVVLQDAMHVHKEMALCKEGAKKIYRYVFEGGFAVVRIILSIEGQATCPMPSNTLIYEMSSLT